MPMATSPRATACWRRWPIPEERQTHGFRHRPADGGAIPGRWRNAPRSWASAMPGSTTPRCSSADCFVAMGAAAVNTKRIRLGTGVLVPSNRIAPVAANALATLNQLAPGRIDFGVGTGFTARRAMGFGAMKVKDMETYIAPGLRPAAPRDGRVRDGRAEEEDPLPQSRAAAVQHQGPDRAASLGLRAAHARADGQAQGRLDRLRRQGRARRQGSAGDMREAWTQGRPRRGRPAGDRLRAGLRAGRTASPPTPSAPWRRPARAPR